MSLEDAVPDGPQKFVLPIVIAVKGDNGPVTAEQFKAGVQKTIDYIATETIPDMLDHDPDDPLPFTVTGSEAVWPFLFEPEAGGPPDLRRRDFLTERQARVLEFALRYLNANFDDVRETVIVSLQDMTEDDVHDLAKALGVDL